MKAVLCNSFTGPADLRLGEIAEPKPADDEILIDVHAASVSFMDQLLVSGLYQMRPPLPFVPGTEASGVVVAIGGKVTTIRPRRSRGVQQLDRRLRRTDDRQGIEERAFAGWRRVRSRGDSAAQLRHGLLCAGRAGTGANRRNRFSSRAPPAVLASPPSTSAAIWACASSPVSAPTTRPALVRGYGASDVVNYRSEDLRGRIKSITRETVSISASTMSAARSSSKWPD